MKYSVKVREYYTVEYLIEDANSPEEAFSLAKEGEGVEIGRDFLCSDENEKFEEHKVTKIIGENLSSEF